MNELLKEFIIKFFLGGLIVGGISVIIKFFSSNFAGQLSGTLPLVLSYTVLLTFLVFNRKKTIDTVYIAILGNIIWVLYAFILYLTLLFNFPLYACFIISVSVWIILSYLYYTKVTCKIT